MWPRARGSLAFPRRRWLPRWRSSGWDPPRISLGERADGDTPTSLASITSSGVTFDTETGHADSDRPTKYVFKNGEGESTGATYDPPTRELFMKHDVKIDWKAATPESKELHIEAPSLYYHEASQQIDLVPNGRLTR